MHSSILFLGLATAFAPLSNAHTVFSTLFVNDKSQGDGTCIRMSKEGNVSTHPIAGGLANEDMACGRDGQEAVAFTCPAPAGAKLTMEFRMWADASQPGSIDPSHLGPMAVYLKPVSDIKSDPAAGPGWFKIWDEGYDPAAKKWATEKLIANNGLLSINLPSALATGYYLARHEIITLQNVTNDKVDAQFYVGCAQLFIQGTAASDSTIPADKQVSIPGHIDAADPGLFFNVYTEDATKYTVVGPDVFFPTSPAATNNNKQTSSNQAQQQQQQQTEGLIPKNCLLKNANWCGTEVPAYTDEAACWTSAENCWKQLDECYHTAPPTGSKGCKIWEEEKCAVIQKSCESSSFPGPSNKGEKLGGDKVDAPIPGGGKLPAAVNAGAAAGDGQEQGQGQGQGGGGGGEVAATPTSAAAAAAATQTKTPVTSRCKNRRRDRRQRRRMN
ncbi:glycoside hydrolase [Chaetomidium leptoderma]|uniref:lytic cellulose monooxygenase (C4-dehydrogenating) n=1 Tax=Chaetomidium leptoderma TaxID=669021 RepID=A0AAN6VJ36_9PEZI|nr:glycoside hydrolase [Chaetomidium leptoderma]